MKVLIFRYFGVSENPVSCFDVQICGASPFVSRHFPGFGHGDFLILNSEYAKPIIFLPCQSIIITDFVPQFFSTDVILIQNFHAVLIAIVPRKRIRNSDVRIRAFSRKYGHSVNIFEDGA